MVHTFTCEQNFYVVIPKGNLKENSSVNMEVFVCLQDIHTEQPGLTILDFFLSVTLMTNCGMCLLISMQSANLVKLWTTIIRMPTY